ncbi:hypothetical protein LADH09A_002800 [Micromonospora sp. LAH09]|uniref:hypothetical protein n=1 Tax=Micromonospora cabrerizensis TaxID=2911213 RepID=UPI001EE82A79|nr:hypothetical protein [Micromonospora cabrerizensis]MCG5468900.1 hypothetical protein [Micromonospora cabrerizensis]
MLTPRLRAARRLAAVIAAVLIGVIAQGAVAVPAEAGTCRTRGCGGRVVNRSGMNIRITNDWCWGTGTAFYVGDKLPCVTQPGNWTANHADAELPSGGDSSYTTIYYYDVDAFRVYRGCITSYYFGSASDVVHTDQPTISQWWRIQGKTKVTITSIRC